MSNDQFCEDRTEHGGHGGGARRGAWCKSCQYNQRGICLYCRNDGADDTLEEACTRRAAEWLQEEAQ